MDDRNTGVATPRQEMQAALEFQPMATRSMFWRPHYLDYVEKSGWMEHIPFAFWLIEAHRPRVLVELGTHAGTSYFAFCQAVERLGLDTRCFAVDTWKGDAHSGLYSESVFERVRAYNDAQYSGFSRLVRSTFDQALGHFSDHTVDLLHIDGLHTLEAVTHDFDSWADKLSDRAVVVMHDTNVRERGFEVFALFEKLKQRFPTFEFVHGHGLGVVAVGPEQGESMSQLFGASGNAGAEREIRDVFARLGRACADTYSAGRAEQREKELAAQVEQHKKQLADALQKVEKLSGEHSGRARDLADARGRLQALVEQHALERGQLAERLSVLKEAREELKASAQRLQANADGVRAELESRTRDIDLLKRQASEMATRMQQSDTAMQAGDAQLARVAQEHERALSGLQSQLVEAAGKLRNNQTQHLESHSLQLGQIAELKQALRARETDLLTTRQQLGVREQALQGEIAGLQQRLQASDQKIAAREQEQQKEVADLRQRLQASDQKIAAREQEQQKEVADLRQRLQASDQKIAAQEQEQQKEVADLRQRLQASDQKIAAREQEQQKEVAELRRQLQSSAQEKAEHDIQLREAKQALEEARVSLKLRFAETSKLTAMTLALEADAAAKESQLQKFKADNEKAKKSALALEGDSRAKDALVLKLKGENEKTLLSVKDRFAEIAKLTSRIVALEHELQIKSDASLAAEMERRSLRRALAQAGADGRRLQQALEEREKQMVAITASRSWKLTSALRRRGSPAAPTPPPVDEAQLIRHSGLFDEAWYLKRYPDVAAGELDPVLHYLEYGAAELRDPGPAFNTSEYLRNNADVEASGINPLRHFIEHGREEGRGASAAP